MFYDTYAELYSRCSVLSSTINVKVSCVQGGINIGAAVSCTPVPDTTTTQWDAWCERPGVRTTQCTPQRPTQLNHRWNSKACGIDKADNTSATNVGPNVPWFWTLSFVSLTTNPLPAADPTIMVTIRQKVLFTFPVLQGLN